MRFIFWKPLGPTQGFDTKNPLLSPSLAIQGHTYVHFCKCSGREQKKEGKRHRRAGPGSKPVGVGSGVVFA